MSYSQGEVCGICSWIGPRAEINAHLMERHGPDTCVGPARDWEDYSAKSINAATVERAKAALPGVDPGLRTQVRAEVLVTVEHLRRKELVASADAAARAALEHLRDFEAKNNLEPASPG